MNERKHVDCVRVEIRLVHWVHLASSDNDTRLVGQIINGYRVILYN